MTLEHVLQQIEPLDQAAMQAAAARQERLTKPTGALGRLEALSIQLAGITGTARPRFARRTLVVAAASHGVAEMGVSAYPSSVTAQMVLNFLAGGAAINVLADQAGAQLVVVDAGVADELPSHPDLRCTKLAPGTRNMLVETAMPRPHAERIVLAGIDFVRELADQGTQVIGVGEMGIGNTTAAAAIAAAMTGAKVTDVTGRGTLIDDARLVHKIGVITRALARHRLTPTDPLGVLSAVGGYEIGLITGVCLGAAARRIPVVLDGYITAAAALLAVQLAPRVRDYLIASHCSVEPGHRIVLQQLGLAPLLDLQMRLGEGSGAALALPLVVAAARLLDEMATFDQAGVDEKEQNRERQR